MNRVILVVTAMMLLAASAPYDSVVTAGAVLIMLVVMLTPRWFADRLTREPTASPAVHFAGRVIAAFANAPAGQKVQAVEAIMAAQPQGVAVFNMGLREAGTLRAVMRACGQPEWQDNGTFTSSDGQRVTETDMLNTLFATITTMRWYMDPNDDEPTERFRRKVR